MSTTGGSRRPPLRSASAVVAGTESGQHLLKTEGYSRVRDAIPNGASRGFHATGVKRMGGHGHDEPYYLHAKHMYNLHRMKHQKPKVYLSVLGAVGIGIAVPVYAVVFQQKKTASG
ncbi:hypothetical protein OsI_15948 [Oryza sativa Indica Group]|uniref:Uncharacterized protein n=1 Tax=Oryza sativa subsp. indica TaxID=39946 RepID=B8ATZ9_ORYSI|nr:hypothetical protein OsI_15948 [Oryza sativa Indica Group]